MRTFVADIWNGGKGCIVLTVDLYMSEQGAEVVCHDTQGGGLGEIAEDAIGQAKGGSFFVCGVFTMPHGVEGGIGQAGVFQKIDQVCIGGF